MEPDPSNGLLDLAYAHVLSQALAVVARLRIADRLESGGRSMQDLARVVEAQAGPLARVMGLLASRGIFMEQGGLWKNTPTSEALIGDDSIRDAVALAGHPIFWNSVGRLGDSVRTGQSGFDAVFGCAFFDYLARTRTRAKFSMQACTGLQWPRTRPSPAATISGDLDPLPMSAAAGEVFFSRSFAIIRGREACCSTAEK